jgi:hypothetical protein
MFSCSLYVGTMIEYLTPSAMPPPFCFRSLSLFLVEGAVLVAVVVLVVGIRLDVVFFFGAKKSREMWCFFSSPSFLSLLNFSRQIRKEEKNDKPHIYSNTLTASFKISSQYLDARTNALSRSTHQLIQNDSNRILTVRFRP